MSRLLVPVLLTAAVSAFAMGGSQRAALRDGPRANGASGGDIVLAVTSARVGELLSLDPSSGAVRVLTQRPRPARSCSCRSGDFDGHPAWSADGRRLAFVRASGVFVLEPGRGRAERVAPRPGAEDFDPAWSSDGRLAFVRSTPAERGFEHTILVVGKDGTATRIADPSRLGYSEPVWAPGATALAYLAGMTRSDIGGGVGLFVTTPAGGVPELLFGGASISSPRWSPGGRTIAFVAQRHRLEPSSVFTVDLTTREVRTVSTNIDFGTGDVAPAWSPSGDRLLFTRIVRGAIFAEHGPEVITVRPDGSGMRRVARNAFGLAWSPDGREVLVLARYLGGEGSQTLSLVRTAGNGRRGLLTLDRRTQGLDPIVGWRS